MRVAGSTEDGIPAREERFLCDLCAFSAEFFEGGKVPTTHIDVDILQFYVRVTLPDPPE